MLFAGVTTTRDSIHCPYQTGNGCTWAKAFWRTLYHDTLFIPGAYGIPLWLSCQLCVPTDAYAFASVNLKSGSLGMVHLNDEVYGSN
jgi:hypothetical protein